MELLRLFATLFMVFYIEILVMDSKSVTLSIELRGQAKNAENTSNRIDLWGCLISYFVQPLQCYQLFLCKSSIEKHRNVFLATQFYQSPSKKSANVPYSQSNILS